MNPDDRAPPKGALEEAVSLCDELLAIVCRGEIFGLTMPEAYTSQLADIRRRRAALEPRLAKLRENQAKLRGDKP